MVNCPVCDAGLDIDEDELDEGDEFTCDECGAELSVIGTDPLEIEPASDADEDEEEYGRDHDRAGHRKPEGKGQTNRIAVLVIAANRGLAGAYNGNVLRAANAFIKRQESEGKLLPRW